MHRRRFLQASVPVVMAFGAGCSFQQEESTELSIYGITIQNLTSEAATFTIEVLEAEETIFQSEQTVSRKSATLIDQSVDDPGDYTIEVALPDQTITQDISLFADDDDTCVHTTIWLDRSGRLRIDGNGYDHCP